MTKNKTRSVTRNYSGVDNKPRDRATSNENNDGTSDAEPETMTLYIRPEATTVVDPATLQALQAIVSQGLVALDRRHSEPIVVTLPASQAPVVAPTVGATPGYVRYVATSKRLKEKLSPTVAAVYRLIRDHEEGLTLPQLVEAGPRRAKNTLRWAIQLLRVGGYVKSEL
jgi:hypothetical protein